MKYRNATGEAKIVRINEYELKVEWKCVEPDETIEIENAEYAQKLGFKPEPQLQLETKNDSHIKNKKKAKK